MHMYINMCRYALAAVSPKAASPDLVRALMKSQSQHDSEHVAVCHKIKLS